MKYVDDIGRLQSKNLALIFIKRKILTKNYRKKIIINEIFKLHSRTCKNYFLQFFSVS